MTARLVAMSQRRDPTGPPHDEIRDALDHRLAGFVAAAGAIPLPVPSGLGAQGLATWLDTLRPGAVLLSGGSDPGADPVRDAVDRALLTYAADRRCPLLGLCRGMQVMGDAAGAGLVAVKNHVACRHDLDGEIARSVNSFHGQALDRLPDGYRLLARAPDGTIEAIAHRDLPWEGWMWHPERDAQLSADDIARAKGIFS